MHRKHIKNSIFLGPLNTFTPRWDRWDGWDKASVHAGFSGPNPHDEVGTVGTSRMRRLGNARGFCPNLCGGTSRDVTGRPMAPACTGCHETSPRMRNREQGRCAWHLCGHRANQVRFWAALGQPGGTSNAGATTSRQSLPACSPPSPTLSSSSVQSGALIPVGT